METVTQVGFESVPGYSDICINDRSRSISIEG